MITQKQINNILKIMVDLPIGKEHELWVKDFMPEERDYIFERLENQDPEKAKINGWEFTANGTGSDRSTVTRFYKINSWLK